MKIDRMEVVGVNVKDLNLAMKFFSEVLEVEFKDDVLAWELGPDGWWKLPIEAGINAHERLQELALERAGWGR